MPEALATSEIYIRGNPLKKMFLSKNVIVVFKLVICSLAWQITHTTQINAYLVARDSFHGSYRVIGIYAIHLFVHSLISFCSAFELTADSRKQPNENGTVRKLCQQNMSLEY